MRTMIVIDRDTGKEESIKDNDPRFAVELRIAADRNDITEATALRALDEGQAIVTPGYIRRLAKQE